MNAHYKFAPSGFGRLMQGAGCWALDRTYPDTSDPEASEEGTAAHEVAFRLARDGHVSTIGELMPNGVAVTREMIDGAILYQNYIREVAGPNVLNIHYEESMRIPCLDLTDCGGTPDAWFQKIAERELHVIDYKFGHAPHEPFEHWQLLAYAIGICELPGVRGGIQRVTLHIVQPRAYHMGDPCRSWSLSLASLEKYRERIKARIIEANNGVADTNTGAACSTCNARHACTALRVSAARAMDYSYLSVPDDMPPTAIGVEMSMIDTALDRLKSRRSGLEAQALAAIRGGKIVPGWAIKHGSGREKWTVPPDQVRALGELFGADLMNAPEPVTPNQARGLLTGKVDLTMLAGMTERPKGEPKLVVEDLTVAARVFGRDAQ